MGIKRIVDTSFWTDDKVVDLFSVEDRYFMLYLLTNPNSKQIGIYKLNFRIAGFETGFEVEKIKELVRKFEDEYKMIRFNYETGEIAIKNYLKHSILKGGKPVSDLIEKEIRGIKDKSLIQYVFESAIDSDITNETIKQIATKYLKMDNESLYDSSTNRTTINQRYAGNENENENENINTCEIEKPISRSPLSETKEKIIPPKNNPEPEKQKKNPSDPDYWSFLRDKEPLGIAFYEATRLYPVGKQFGLWIKGFNELSEAGITSEVIPRAVKKMREQGLTIKSPESILAIAREIMINAGKAKDGTQWTRA